jgi:hypothetical protein
MSVVGSDCILFIYGREEFVMSDSNIYIYIYIYILILVGFEWKMQQKRRGLKGMESLESDSE